MGLLQQTSLTVLARWTGFVLDGVASILVARRTGPTGKGTLTGPAPSACMAMQRENVDTTHVQSAGHQVLGAGLTGAHRTAEPCWSHGSPQG